MTALYLIALGSNQRHPHFGNPRQVLTAAAARLDGDIGEVLTMGPVIDSKPVGPSIRRYANSALVLESDLEPHDLLAALKRIESEFGRISMGQRWRSRVIDLDIILWSEGIVESRELTIPHILFRERDFVLGPAAAIAPLWRDPLTGLSLRHLHSRLTGGGSVPR